METGDFTAEMYICPSICDVALPTEHEMQAHISAVHCQYVPYACNICWQLYPTVYHLVDHFQAQHGALRTFEATVRIDVAKLVKLDNLVQQCRVSTAKLQKTRAMHNKMVQAKPSIVSRASGPTLAPHRAFTDDCKVKMTKFDTGDTTRDIQSRTESRRLLGAPKLEVKSQPIESSPRGVCLETIISAENAIAAASVVVTSDAVSLCPIKSEFSQQPNFSEHGSHVIDSAQQRLETTAAPKPQQPTKSCPLCGLLMTNNHDRAHDPTNKLFKCNICVELYFGNRRNADRHMQRYHAFNKNAEMLPLNDTEASNSRSPTHETEGKIKQEQQDQLLLNDNELEWQPTSCSECAICGEANTDGHADLHNPVGKRMQCMACDRVYFNDWSAVHAHVQAVHHNIRPRIWPIGMHETDKMSESVQETNANANQCDVCGRESANPKRHLQLHVSEGKTHKCSVCPQTYFPNLKAGKNHVFRQHKHETVKILKLSEQSENGVHKNNETSGAAQQSVTDIFDNSRVLKTDAMPFVVTSVAE